MKFRLPIESGRTDCLEQFGDPETPRSPERILTKGIRSTGRQNEKRMTVQSTRTNGALTPTLRASWINLILEEGIS